MVQNIHMKAIMCTLRNGLADFTHADDPELLMVDIDTKILWTNGFGHPLFVFNGRSYSGITPTGGNIITKMGICNGIGRSSSVICRLIFRFASFTLSKLFIP